MMKRTGLFILLFVTVAFLNDVPDVYSAKAETADKTQVNQPDREFTADQQAETKNDRDINQKIRDAVVADKSLSTNAAHNLKIITVGGMVTLKGPVRSEQEKNVIEEIAAGIVGKSNIKSEIEIAPKKSDK